MKCRTCLAHLDDWLDHTISAKRQEAVDTHLLSCEDCAKAYTQAQSWQRGLQELPTPAVPEDAWAGIVSRIQSAPSKEPLAVEPLRPLWWAMGKRLTALAVFLGCLGLGWWIASSPSSNQTQRPQHLAQRSSPAPQQHSTRKGLARRMEIRPVHRRSARRALSPAQQRTLRLALESVQQASVQYRTAIQSMESLLAQQPKRKRSRALRALLTQIEQALLRAEAAAKRDPSAVEPQRVLLALYQRKVDVLRDVLLGRL